MPDVTTLAVLAGLLMSVIAGQAALFSDTLHLQIIVPKALQDKGFTEPVAEELFSAEAARIIYGKSVIPAPGMRIHSQPNLLTALVEPFRLGSAVDVLQSSFGIDRLDVVAAIMQGGKPEEGAGRPPGGTNNGSGANGGPTPTPQQLQIVLVVSEPDHEPAQLRLTDENGDPVVLVQRAAQWTMERVSPFRVAAAHYIAGTKGDPNGFVQARQSATRSLIRPWQRSEASERAMLYNVIGLVDAAENNLTSALSAFRSAEQVPEVLPAVRAEMALNNAVVELALKRPARAAELLKVAKQNAPALDEENQAIQLRLIDGLIAWGKGDLVAAEAIFRRVAADAPLNEAGHRYLGRVLAARGDTEASAKALAAALAVHSAEPPQQALAIALFWVDPVDGGLTRRF